MLKKLFKKVVQTKELFIFCLYYFGQTNFSFVINDHKRKVFDRFFYCDQFWKFENVRKQSRTVEKSRERSKKVENGRKKSRTVEKVENSWSKTSTKAVSLQIHDFFIFFVFDCSRLIFDWSKSMNVRWRSEMIFEWSQKKGEFVQSQYDSK